MPVRVPKHGRVPERGRHIVELVTSDHKISTVLGVGGGRPTGQLTPT
jgi:hypothetical protein